MCSFWRGVTSICDGFSLLLVVVVALVILRGLEDFATRRGGGRVVRHRLMNGNGSVWLLLLSLQQYTAIDGALDKLLLKLHSFLL